MLPFTLEDRKPNAGLATTTFFNDLTNTLYLQFHLTFKCELMRSLLKEF